MINALSQFPKILVMMPGGYKIEATWMTGHMYLARRY
jgi:hypothetical protein